MTPPPPPSLSPDVRWVEGPGAVPYCSFPLIDATGLVTCGFSTRVGGVSPPPFDSLNLGTTTKDDIENVRVNRDRFGAALGGYEVLEWVDLVHGNAVHEAVARDEGTFRRTERTPRADAVISRVPGLPLAIYTADCVPIVFVDPVTPAIGLAHAGWRGTVEDVAGATVAAMQARYQTDPARLLCGIGACIGPCCFEVHQDVADLVRARYPQWQDLVAPLNKVPLNKDRWLDALSDSDPVLEERDKFRVDLWQLNARQLEQAGVPRRNIAISRLCTACRADLFFSYRRDRRETGRLSMFVALQ